MEGIQSYSGTRWCIGNDFTKILFTAFHIRDLKVSYNKQYSFPPFSSYYHKKQVYTGSFSLGMGGIPWVIMSEVVCSFHS